MTVATHPSDRLRPLLRRLTGDEKHSPSAYSTIDVLWVLYDRILRISPEKPEEPDRDRFLLSKGHGPAAYYAVLAAKGFFPVDWLDDLGGWDSPLGHHPDRIRIPGVEIGTGSLGHGLGIGVGMAYAEYLKETDCGVYVVLSDGELQEGSTWEAAQMAANHKLERLLLFVDLNDFGGLERISEHHPAVFPVVEKFQAFGWEAVEVNGHDAAAMHAAVAARKGGKPFVLVCKTVKGRGVSYMEHVPIWHYRSPNKDEYAQAMRELVEVSA